MSRIHVIGAGLAGLAAALSLSAAGRPVTVYEAGPVAGGRCRSYFDRELELTVDNGNHLMLSGNAAVRAFLTECGAEDRCVIGNKAMFPFVDAKTGFRWTIHPNNGRIPWWILVSSRAVPKAKLSDYLALARIADIDDDTTVADAMRRGWLYWHLVEPLAVAALNTPSDEGLAKLLGAVLRETLLRGGHNCIPILPRQNLSDSLIDPAVATLQQRGVDVRFSTRVATLVRAGGRVVALRGPGGDIAVEPGDAVVLATPSWIAAELLPGLVTPDEYQSIINLHFRYVPTLVGPVREVGLVGVIGGTAEWVFVKPGHVSVTISAANRLIDYPPETIASRAWPNVVEALQLGRNASLEIPPHRVVKEKRATHAATARQEARRPGTRTELAANLALAGDWTDTGLPATIEGAIRSGRSAAEYLLGT